MKSEGWGQGFLDPIFASRKLSCRVHGMDNPSEEVTPLTTYVVVYEIPARPRYIGGSTRVTLTEGYNTFEDIRQMIAITRGVTRDEIKITSLALLAN